MSEETSVSFEKGSESISYEQRLQQLNPRFDQAQRLRREMRNTWSVRATVRAHSGEIREKIIEEIKENSPDGWLLQQYVSLGIELFPETSNNVGKHIKVKPGESCCMGPTTIQSPNWSVESRADQLISFFKEGYIKGAESTKLHEVSHCFNAYGLALPYDKSLFARAITELKTGFYPRSNLAAVLQEGHSMWTQSLLAGDVRFGPSTDQDEYTSPDLYRNLSTFVMNHPDVSGQGDDPAKVAKRARRVYQNFLRMLVVGETLGSIGSFFGVRRRLIKENKAGHFPRWEDHIIQLAKSKGDISSDSNRQESLEMIDQRIPELLRKIEFEIKLLKYATVKSVINSCLENDPESAILLEEMGPSLKEL